MDTESCSEFSIIEGMQSDNQEADVVLQKKIHEDRNNWKVRQNPGSTEAEPFSELEIWEDLILPKDLLSGEEKPCHDWEDFCLLSNVKSCGESLTSSGLSSSTLKAELAASQTHQAQIETDAQEKDQQTTKMNFSSLPVEGMKNSEANNKTATDTFRDDEFDRIVCLLSSTQAKYMREKVEKVELRKQYEKLKHDSCEMKSHNSMLDKQLKTEKRNLQLSNRYAEDLKRFYQNSTENSLRENMQLRRKIRNIQKRGTFVRQLPKKQLDYSSDTDTSEETGASRAMSYSSLNEFTAVLERKMEGIADRYSEQIGRMQADIGKLMAGDRATYNPQTEREDPRSETNSEGCRSIEGNTSYEDSTSQLVQYLANAKVNGLNDTVIRNYMKYSKPDQSFADSMRQLSTLPPPSRAEVSSSFGEDDSSEPSGDEVNEAESHGNEANEVKSSSDEVNEAPRNGDEVNEAPRNGDEVNEAPRNGDEVNEAARNGDEANHGESDEPEATDEAFAAPGPQEMTCPNCDYKCHGDYSVIAEHYNNFHVDKLCPLCDFTVAWNEEEQLNCHVQAHLDEEDAKAKHNRRGWIFSSLNFD